MNLKKQFLNRLSGLFFRHYADLLPKAVQDRLPGYTHVLIESGPAPLLTPLIRRKAPDAQIVYHAADRLKTIAWLLWRTRRPARLDPPAGAVFSR